VGNLKKKQKIMDLYEIVIDNLKRNADKHKSSRDLIFFMIEKHYYYLEFLLRGSGKG